MSRSAELSESSALCNMYHLLQELTKTHKKIDLALKECVYKDFIDFNHIEDGAAAMVEICQKMKQDLKDSSYNIHENCY